MTNKPSIIIMMESDDEEINRLAYQTLLAMIDNPTFRNEIEHLCNYILAPIDNAYAYRPNIVSPNIYFRNSLSIIRNWCKDNSV